MASNYISTSEAAKLLGVSRITVFNKIKKGEIKAQKIGRNFVIDKSELENILKEALTKEKKLFIEKVVDKTIKDYGETLKLLGAE